jgi:methionine-rich copper-binding protein CopC
MRATREIFMRLKSSRSAIVSAAALAVLAIAACGELTGPKSPSTPTNVVATLASATSATVTWTPSPLNDGVISYSIYRNGSKVGESTTTTYTDTGLAQQTTYVYSVAANCKSGVISDRSVETAQSTITTVDITPPRVIANQPPANFVGVSSGATATVTFSEPMDSASVVGAFTLRVTSGGAAIPGTVSYNKTTRVAEFKPTSALPNPVSITATVTTAVKDLAGNAMAAAFTWAFTTRDDTAPTVTATSPVNGATGVSASTAVTITFSEALDPATVTTTNITMRATGSGTAVAGTVAYNTTTHVVTFTPNAALAAVSYTVVATTGIKDAAGNAMSANFQFAFTVGDTSAPTVTAVIPANNATGVAVNSTVKVTFSEPMDPLTINATTITLRPTATGINVAATVAYDAPTNTATLTPTGGLSGNTNYTVTVTTGAKDAAGNALAAVFNSAFTTVDSTPPTVVGVVPTNGAINVTTNSTVQITFSEAMDQTTLTTTNVTLKNTATTTVVPVTLSYDVGTNRLTLTPTGPLSNATNYTVTVTTAVKDLAGNALAAQFTSSFTTVTVTDTTAPTIVSRTPANGATNVATNTTVTVTFSEPMDSTTITTTTVSLKPTAGGANVAATVVCTPLTPCTTVTLTPTAALDNNTSYTVTITTGVKDRAGNALAAQSTSTFTTVADTTPPTITATSPINGATGVATSAVVTVTFSEDMDITTINGTTFTLKTTVGSIPVTGVVSYNTTTRVATFTPSGALTANTNYTATVTNGAKDAAGNALAVNASFSFTTAP